MKYAYTINEKDFEVILNDHQNYDFGEKEILSEKFGDLTAKKDWFEDGFKIINSANFYDAVDLYSATTEAVKKIIDDLNPNIPLDQFKLEDYHNYVDDDLHSEVIKLTRRIFPKDLRIDVNKIVEAFGEYMGTTLSFANPVTKEEHWMIARINKPHSKNFNTVHKDIYEVYDSYGTIPRMVNVWVPICGVGDNSSLPVAPGSHKLPEDVIKRTRAGSSMNGNHYSVASIMQWGGGRNLITPVPKRDEFLIFSSHLIHGIAYNANMNETRVSFEFRLYEVS